MIAAMNGSAHLAALGTPTDISVQMDLDREMVEAPLDAATDATLRNGKRDGHASHVGKLSLNRHQPESIGRYPRKVSKSHEIGAISQHRLTMVATNASRLGKSLLAMGSSTRGQSVSASCSSGL